MSPAELLYFVLTLSSSYFILSYLPCSLIASCLISPVQLFHSALSFMSCYCILSDLSDSFLHPVFSRLLIYCILSSLPSFIACFLISPLQLLYPTLSLPFNYSILSFLSDSFSFIACFLISPLRLLHLVQSLLVRCSILLYVSCSVNAPCLFSPLQFFWSVWSLLLPNQF